MRREGVLFCLVGPAGSGKTTIGQKLLQSDSKNIRISISATSRSPRPGEKDGVSYFFLSREAFEAKIKDGQLLEWEETHGNLYGTFRSTVEDSIKTGIDLILDIDIRGALNFKRLYPTHTVIVFLLPPSFDVLLQRLRGRAGESEGDIQIRIDTASREYTELLADGGALIDYMLVNDVLEVTTTSVRNILEVERHRLSRLKREILQNMCKLGNRSQGD